MFKFPVNIISRCLLSGIFACAISSCSCRDPLKPNVNKNEDKSGNTLALAEVIGLKEEPIEALANVKGIKDNQVTGTVKFIKVPTGIKIIADLEGLTPGEHGFHIHEFGDCGDKGSAAGGHFNPENHKHGGPDSAERHVGDLGNVKADQSGRAHYERIDKMIKLEGEDSIIGRSIIIHADPDDFVSQPAGNSGARIGCGIIGSAANGL